MKVNSGMDKVPPDTIFFLVTQYPNFTFRVKVFTVDQGNQARDPQPPRLIFMSVARILFRLTMMTKRLERKVLIALLTFFAAITAEVETPSFVIVV